MSGEKDSLETKTFTLPRENYMIFSRLFVVSEEAVVKPNSGMIFHRDTDLDGAICGLTATLSISKGKSR